MGDKTLGLGAMITDNPAKSLLVRAGHTVEMQGTIGVHRAAASADTSNIGFLACGMPQQHQQNK